MKRFKLIASWVAVGLVVALGVGYVVGALGAWETLPYKQAFVEYQRISFREARFISLQKDEIKGLTKLGYSKKEVRKIQDSLALAEENMYKTLCEFPEKYQEYAVAASLLHEQSQNLRIYRRNGFKKTENDPFAQYKVALDSISHNYHDCCIIRKVERKKRIVQ